MRFYKTAFVLFLVLIIASCNSSSVEEDMNTYCDCLHNNELSECDEIKIDIIKKYEFDPAASSYINERLHDCVE